MTTTATELRVWVGCLACYSAGVLVGEWLAPADGPDWECPKDGTHEETWVFDSEGFGRDSGEASPREYAEKAEGIMLVAEACALPVEVAALALDQTGYTPEALADGCYYGEWDSLAAWVEDAIGEGLFGEDVMALSRNNPGWVDVDQIVTDIECEGSMLVVEHGGSVYLWGA